MQFLCDHGGDPNKGQRSSSLHYAACFGRPQICKILIRYGANPDLRDEDGKTPLDKARERNDEAHREVANLLQSPAEWMSCSLNNSDGKFSNKKEYLSRLKKKSIKINTNSTTSTTTTTINNENTTAINDDSSSSKNQQQTLLSTSDDGEIDSSIIAINEPELVDEYIRKLLPIFCDTYQNSMIRQIKKTSLNLIRKIVFYMSREQLINLNTNSNLICLQIAEVISNCCQDLGTDEDEECCFIALQMVQDLMDKEFNLFLEHFSRLGIFSRVQCIAEINELNNNTSSLKEIETKKSIYSASNDVDQEIELDKTSLFNEDCKEMQIARPYHWRDTNIVRSKDCLYLWSDYVILELSNGSNGWFRFILDSKLATMYSSGSPEGTESIEDRNELFEKLR